jgi:hypothetical protein
MQLADNFCRIVVGRVRGVVGDACGWASRGWALPTPWGWVG